MCDEQRISGDASSLETKQRTGGKPGEAEKPFVETSVIQDYALQRISGSLCRISSRELASTIAEKFSLDRKQVGAIIKALVSNGELVYTYEFGCSFLEKSFQKPVRIAKRVILLPSDLSYQPAPGDVPVRIKPGASFGSGQHPTTRLAIRGIEHVLKSGMNLLEKKNTTILDVGTGSGVLVITAVKLGVSKGIGIDVDPCARAEAMENIIINGLEGRIRILDQPPDHIDFGRRIAMIAANLRTPSLGQLRGHFTDIIDEGGVVVLSGIKIDELQDLIDVYAVNKLQPCWQETEKGWAGVVMQKK